MTFGRALIFDFDFTLVDSSKGFIECHNFAAERSGLPSPAPETVRRTIGTPLPLAFVELYGAADEATIRPYVELYQARADEVMTPLTHLLPATAATIDALRKRSLALAIVSQKLRFRIEDVLRREGLLSSFDVIIGGEDLTRLKPDPEGLLLAVSRLGAAGAVYVGDTVIDAGAAENAGLPFVAVLTGATLRDEFAPFRPAAILDDLATLPDLCDRWCWSSDVAAGL
jgi:phosphoglycolate phosphatase